MASRRQAARHRGRGRYNHVVLGLLFLKYVSDAFEARREWWTGVLFYDLHEPPVGRDCGTAITRADWSNRPAFRLFQAFMRAHP